MKRALVIAGPTASGKSSAAMALADRLGGEIVNSDAMQVYRDLRILTARPSDADEAKVPHHLYGVSTGDDPWSAGRFARQAAGVLDDILARGALPIVVGGTGLWLKALTEGLSPMPEVPGAVLAGCEVRLAEIGMAAFREEVVADDPAMARLEPQDRQRHLRAAAVMKATGRPLSEWQAEPARPVTGAEFIRVALVPPRELSHRAVASRLCEMVEEGALEEVGALMARGYDPAQPVMKAVGVPEFAAHLSGALTLEEAIERATVATRQLVKRQTTWLNGQFGDWPRAEDAGTLIRLCQEELAKRPPFEA